MKWMSVKKMMPSSDTYVLVCLSGKFQKISFYFEDSFGKWFSTDHDGWDKKYTGSVTHWMPLPDLPSIL